MLKKDIPNILTLFRIFLIPVLIGCFYFDRAASSYLAAGIFIFACITDYFDGLLARILSAQTRFGALLDPIADKMLVAATLIMIVKKDMAPVIPIIAILCREFLVSGLREYLAEIRVSLPVTGLAKIKTTIQMISIVLILLQNELTIFQNTKLVATIAIWLTAIITVFTGYIYLKEGMKKFN